MITKNKIHLNEFRVGFLAFPDGGGPHKTLPKRKSSY